MSDDSFNDTGDANPLLGQLLAFHDVLEDVIGVMTEMASDELDETRFKELTTEVVGKCAGLSDSVNGGFYHVATITDAGTGRRAIITLDIEMEDL